MGSANQKWIGVDQLLLLQGGRLDKFEFLSTVKIAGGSVVVVVLVVVVVRKALVATDIVSVLLGQTTFICIVRFKFSVAS